MLRRSTRQRATSGKRQQLAEEQAALERAIEEAIQAENAKKQFEDKPKRRSRKKTDDDDDDEVIVDELEMDIDDDHHLDEDFSEDLNDLINDKSLQKVKKPKKKRTKRKKEDDEVDIPADIDEESVVVEFNNLAAVSKFDKPNIHEFAKKRSSSQYIEKLISKIDHLGSNYGENKYLNIGILKYAMDWGQFYFQIDLDIVNKHYEEAKKGEFCLPKLRLLPELAKPINQSLLEFDLLDENFEKNPDTNIKFKLQNSETIHKLVKDEFFHLNDFEESRNSIIVNVDGIITDLIWLIKNPETNRDNINYLFVATCPKSPSINNQFIDEDLSVFKFNFDKDYITILKCFEVNTENKDIKLTKSWKFGNGWGIIREMKFLPIENYYNKLGLLGILFGDGVLRFFQVEKNLTIENYFIKKPNLEITPPKHHFFTTFDFSKDHSVIIGTNKGFIAKYLLKESLTIPTFFIKKHFQLITKVLIQPEIPNYSNELLHTKSFDSYWKTTDLNNLNQINLIQKKRFYLGNALFEYNPNLRCIMFESNPSVGKGNTSFNHFGSFLNFMKVHFNSLITSFNCSHYHPFVLGGTNSGYLLMNNCSQIPVLTGKRLTKYLKQIKLLQVEFNSDKNLYKISTNYSIKESNFSLLQQKSKKEFEKKVQDFEKNVNDNLFINNEKPFPSDENFQLNDLIDDDKLISYHNTGYPNEINITKLKWNDNLDGCNWFAMALSKDLVLIDCLETLGG